MFLNAFFLMFLAEYALAVGRSHIPSFAGPVRMQVSQVVPCPESKLGKNVIRIHDCIVKQTRDKSGRRFYCTMENLEPLNDLNQAKLSLASWSRVSGWAENAFILRLRKFCTDSKTFYIEALEFFEEYAKDGEKFCPRGPGNLTVNGCPTDFTPNKSLFSSFPYGRYRADVSILKNSTTLGCVRMIVDAVPRIKEGQN